MILKYTCPICGYQTEEDNSEQWPICTACYFARGKATPMTRDKEEINNIIKKAANAVTH